MKRAVLICLLLAGCSSFRPHIVEESIHNSCFAIAFSEYADCFQQGLDRNATGWRSGPDASVWSLYLAWVRSTADLVENRNITELQARTALTRFHAEVAGISRDIYWNAGVAEIRLRALSPPDFREVSGSAGPALSCTSISLGGGISDIRCN